MDFLDKQKFLTSNVEIVADRRVLPERMVRHAFVPSGVIPLHVCKIQKTVFRSGDRRWIPSICNNPIIHTLTLINFVQKEGNSWIQKTNQPEVTTSSLFIPKNNDP